MPARRGVVVDGDSITVGGWLDHLVRVVGGSGDAGRAGGRVGSCRRAAGRAVALGVPRPAGGSAGVDRLAPLRRPGAAPAARAAPTRHRPVRPHPPGAVRGRGRLGRAAGHHLAVQRRPPARADALPTCSSTSTSARRRGGPSRAPARCVARVRRQSPEVGVASSRASGRSRARCRRAGGTRAGSSTESTIAEVAVGVGVLQPDVAEVGQQPMQPTGQLAGQLETDLGVGGEERVGIADDPDGGRSGRGDRGRPGRAEERRDLTDEPTGLGHVRQVRVGEVDPQRTLHEDGHRAGLGVALPEQHLVRVEPSLRHAGRDAEDVAPVGHAAGEGSPSSERQSARWASVTWAGVRRSAVLGHEVDEPAQLGVVVRVRTPLRRGACAARPARRAPRRGSPRS